MKKLPIGISTFSEIITNGYIYVDKTAFIQQLTNAGKFYFLSRPRRFGKSLLVDTLRELFEANEKLFAGLAIHRHWDWSIEYPIISLNFAAGALTNRDQLDQRIRHLLNLNRQRLGVQCENVNDIPSSFGDLIRKTKEKYDQNVVILVDEYDKPILDNITSPNIAADMREGLKNLYSVIKEQDANIRFAFLTGVSKFSKVSIFSGLNNLQDITLDPRYATLCGYTQAELEQCFAAYLQNADLEQVKAWYNGYNWLGESVYNPFDVLLFLDTGQSFRPYWFETGTPAFLVELFKAKQYHLPDLENVTASFAALGDFDVGRLRPETLLFQAGYLTIKREDVFFNNAPVYTLGYPNREVRYSLMEFLLENYLTDVPQERHSAYQALSNNDFPALKQRLVALFDSIANDHYRNNPIAQYEGYYSAVIYAFLCSLGLDTRAEESSNKGRVDIALRFSLPDGQKQVYIFEFKVIDSELPDGSALQQLKNKDYAAAYRDGQQRIFLIGIEFSKATRNIVGFDVERLNDH